MKPLNLLDVHIIFQTIKKYPTFEVYPFVFYVSRDNKIVDVPTKENTKVETWLIPFIDACGLVVQRINNGEVVLRAYEITATVEEKNELVENLLGRLVKFVNTLRLDDAKLFHINKHVIDGISVALGLDPGTVSDLVYEAKMRRRLEDRVVAIFGDIVVLLSKKKFMERFDGEKAVELARKYSIVLDAPISYIAENHIPRVLGTQVSVFIFPDASIICNPVTCYNIPLPSNLSFSIAKKSNATIVDLERGKPELYSNTRLPAPYFCVAKNKILLLEPLDKQYKQFKVKEARKTLARYSAPLVFSPSGFLGYGKISVKNGRIAVEVVEVEREREEKEEGKEEDYLEEVVLGS